MYELIIHCFLFFFMFSERGENKMDDWLLVQFQVLENCNAFEQHCLQCYIAFVHLYACFKNC